MRAWTSSVCALVLALCACTHGPSDDEIHEWYATHRASIHSIVDTLKSHEDLTHVLATRAVDSNYYARTYRDLSADDLAAFEQVRKMLIRTGAVVVSSANRLADNRNPWLIVDITIWREGTLTKGRSAGILYAEGAEEALQARTRTGELTPFGEANWFIVRTR